MIQCAGTKRCNAGCLTTLDGRKVLFVGDPATAPPSQKFVYARPDDIADTGITWRETLLRYNRAPGNNPLALLSAGELYENSVYRRIVQRFGTNKTYIISAGWGLINASFLTPDYDITFSQLKPAYRYKRRKRNDLYHDFAMLSDDTDEPIVLFASDKYLSLFSALTSRVRGQRTVFYSTDNPRHALGCTLVKFNGTRSTNWQYDCANAFLDGAIGIPR